MGDIIVVEDAVSMGDIIVITRSSITRHTHKPTQLHCIQYKDLFNTFAWHPSSNAWRHICLFLLQVTQAAAAVISRGMWLHVLQKLRPLQLRRLQLRRPQLRRLQLRRLQLRRLQLRRLQLHHPPETLLGLKCQKLLQVLRKMLQGMQSVISQGMQSKMQSVLVDRSQRAHIGSSWRLVEIGLVEAR